MEAEGRVVCLEVVVGHEEEPAGAAGDEKHARANEQAYFGAVDRGAEQDGNEWSDHEACGHAGGGHAQEEPEEKYEAR